MENYIVSARKYRPQTFESVVGQQALTQTLQNAIRQNRLAHAYLFCCRHRTRFAGLDHQLFEPAKRVRCLQRV